MSEEQLPTQPAPRPSPGESAKPTSLCEQITAALPAYSIGATDPEEEALVQAGLAACPQAADELAGYAALAAALHQSVAPVQPPSRLEAQLRAAIRQPVGTRPRQSAQHQSWRWAIMWRAAAVAAILLLTIFCWYALEQNRQLRRPVVATTLRQAIELPPAQAQSNASAQVRWDPESQVALLYANAFPPLQPDQVYQLWLNRDGVRQSGGLFTVDEDGAGLLLFPVDGPLDTLDAMGVTQEPAGGSPGPTGQPVVRRRFDGS
jgi:anti-sigma-K factor RskA